MTSSSSTSSSSRKQDRVQPAVEGARGVAGQPARRFKHRVSDNLQRWVIKVAWVAGTLYAGETYQLQVDFPEHYLMEAPQVIFLNPAPMHPHIYSNGHICLGYIVRLMVSSLDRQFGLFQHLVYVVKLISEATPGR
ncbi:hypothetical protein ACP70R_024711 [Stipagrostis hirtigluma subsp. patula]